MVVRLSIRPAIDSMAARGGGGWSGPEEAAESQPDADHRQHSHGGEQDAAGSVVAPRPSFRRPHRTPKPGHGVGDRRRFAEQPVEEEAGAGGERLAHGRLGR